jgi:ABC-type branched-subunit amino acid transport system substrate-binding protein
LSRNRSLSKWWLFSSAFALLACGKPAPGGPPEPEPEEECSADPSLPQITVGGIFTLTQGGNGAQDWAKEMLNVVANEVNNGCGTSNGATLKAEFRDGQDKADVSGAVTRELLELGAKFIVGAGGSAGTEAAVPLSVAAKVPFGAFSAVTGTVSGCTAAQLSNTAVTKSSTPVYSETSCYDHQGYFFRTVPRGLTWGRTAAKFLIETAPSATRIALLARNDPSGVPLMNGVRAVLESAGKTVGAPTSFAANATVAAFEGILKNVAGTTAPHYIVTNGRIGEIKSLIIAYGNLLADTNFTKPAGFDQIKFYFAASVRGDYTALSPAQLKIMKEQTIGLEPYWDPESTGWKKWWAVFQAHDVTGVADKHATPRVYDAAMLMSLAMVKGGSTDGAEIKKHIHAIANPPGEVVYPGEYRKARALLLQGVDINYEGASGPADLVDTGDIVQTPYQIWGTNLEGDTRLIRTYEAPAQ